MLVMKLQIVTVYSTVDQWKVYHPLFVTSNRSAVVCRVCEIEQLFSAVFYAVRAVY
jgi:cadmium resistance protein CadD (predicted permease)